MSLTSQEGQAVTSKEGEMAVKEDGLQNESGDGEIRPRDGGFPFERGSRVFPDLPVPVETKPTLVVDLRAVGL